MTTPATGPDYAPDPAFERRLILATQAGLPLVPDPWGAVAATLGVEADSVLAAVRDMLARGVIRRIGAVPNHYAIGYTANGMCVWDIDDGCVEAAGRLVGALDTVTHCYQRPRRLPEWRYNLFAMVHGASREAVGQQVAEIAATIEAAHPGACRAREVLFSSAILKKTGLRIAG